VPVTENFRVLFSSNQLDECSVGLSRTDTSTATASGSDDATGKSAEGQAL